MIKLNNLNLKNITEQLIDTFLKAGNIAKEINQRGVKITIKSDKSPVTDGDIAVNNILKDKINSLTPNIPIISEETEELNDRNNKDTFWLIDPIDGTSDYIQGRDEFTVNAGLIIENRAEIGIINAPAKERLFYTYRYSNRFDIFHIDFIVNTYNLFK